MLKFQIRLSLIDSFIKNIINNENIVFLYSDDDELKEWLQYTLYVKFGIKYEFEVQLQELTVEISSKEYSLIEFFALNLVDS